jgi:uncharacterized protein YciI
VRCSNTFLLLYEYVEDMSVRRTSFRAAHLALSQMHKEQGKVVMGGAFSDAVRAPLPTVWCVACCV